MNMYILFKMFVLCYFVILTCIFFDKINVLYFTLLTLSEPSAVGNLFQVKTEENYVVDRLLSSIGVDLYTSCKQDRGRANKDV